jgi:hypothetical protein
VKDNLETYPEDYDEDEQEARKEFLDHELTKEDKLEILEIIKDKYEYESCSLEYEVSIFDEDNIRDCICEWINGNFEFEENKVSENAYNGCDNAAHSAEKIVGNAHKGELNALGKKDFVFVFDKSDEHHHGAGNYGNNVRDDNYDVVIQINTSVINYKKTARFSWPDSFKFCKQH